MPQIGESVSIVDIADTNHDESCCFCNWRDDQDQLQNELDDDPNEDADAEADADAAPSMPGLEEGGIAFKNDSNKLGKALVQANDEPKIQDFEVSVDDAPFPSGGAAHHLIPGNASLKRSLFFKEEKYLFDGQGGIGYNVNSSANGVWLPGNYAMRGKWSGRSDKFKQAYAAGSIEKWCAQFHDAHPDYSEVVRKTLDTVFHKIAGPLSLYCPEESQRQEGKVPPPLIFGLVARFNTISARMRRKLEFPVHEKWFKNVFTSGRSVTYMNALPQDAVPMDTN